MGDWTYKSHRHPTQPGWEYESLAYVASGAAAITNITGTIAPGQTINVSTQNIGTITTATFGGRPLEIQGTAVNSVTCLIPSDIALIWNEGHTLTVGDGADTASQINVTLNIPANGLTSIYSAAPDFVATESFVELAAANGVGDLNYSASVGEHLQIFVNTGAVTALSVDGFTIPTINPAQSIIGTFAFFNPGNGQRTATANFAILTEADSTPPVVTLNGLNPLTLEINTAYIELGATSNDNIGGDISAGIVITGSVDTSTIGQYQISYSSTDAAGNNTTISRTVNVVAVDSVAPVITLLGGQSIDLVLGSPFIDPGVTASDDTDGDITANVIVTGAVDTNTLGSYTISYNVSDAVGNAAVQVQRTVNVLALPDVINPIITLQGDNPLSAFVGFSFVDPGYTAVDETDGDITPSVTVTGSVDTDTIGSYSITYSASDAAGNVASVVRTVNVVAVVAGQTNEPVDARIYALPGADAGIPTSLYRNNTNYIVATDILGAFTHNPVSVQQAVIVIQNELEQTIFGPLALTRLEDQWVISTPHDLELLDNTCTITVEIDSSNNSQGRWVRVFDIEDREE
ncbi:MAG: DUF5011 domain-containing protein [Agarilytica sp.]